MLPVAATITGVLALLLLALLLLTRRRHSLAQLTADTKERALLQELQDTSDQLASAQAEQRSLQDERDTAQEEAAAATTKSDELGLKLQTSADEIAALRATHKTLQTSERDSIVRIRSLEQDAESLRSRVSSVEPRALWELELQRSERTWRHSVSVAPETDHSPFPDASDPLQLAVEIEAAALKEEAGAFLTVDWQAAPVEDPARAHLILRLAQELLAEAAREPIPVCLVASGTGAVTLVLTPAQDRDREIKVDLHTPRVRGRLIEVDPERPARITITYG